MGREQIMRMHKARAKLIAKVTCHGAVEERLEVYLSVLRSPWSKQ